MTSERLNDYVHSIFLIIVFVLVGSVFIYRFYTPEENKEVPSKFEVIDKYKNCEVVKWIDPSGNWKYFLDCN